MQAIMSAEKLNALLELNLINVDQSKPGDCMFTSLVNIIINLNERIRILEDDSNFNMCCICHSFKNQDGFMNNGASMQNGDPICDNCLRPHGR